MTRSGPVSAVLADPRIQFGVGMAALLATAGAVQRDRVRPWEARAFRAVNDLPDSWHLPAWVVMQLGAFGAVPATAAAAWLAGDGELAGRFLAGGAGSWALSKVVKEMVRRPRPGTLLPGIRRRGPEAAGLGYLSGHAGVAVALGAAAIPRLGPAGRVLTVSAIALVGLTRVYVGAHLPLDIAGGAALGLAVNAAAGLVSAERLTLPGGRPAAVCRRPASPVLIRRRVPRLGPGRAVPAWKGRG
jgi:membrane-associated phospholipid phosphatase